MCEAEKKEFVVDTPEKADWALKKLRGIKSKINEVNERTQAGIAEWTDWQKKELGKLTDDELYFTALLNEYAESNRDDDGKFKFSSPYGKIYTRKSKQWTYDEEKILSEYKDTEVVRNVPKLNKNELKKRIEFIDGKPVDKETGAIVDGVSVEEKSKVNIKTED